MATILSDAAAHALQHHHNEMLQLNDRHALTGARCKVLRCVEWEGPNRGPKRYRQPETPYDQVVNQKVQGNATLTAGELCIPSFTQSSLLSRAHIKAHHAVVSEKAFACPQSMLWAVCALMMRCSTVSTKWFSARRYWH